jgi:hypothetical protein
VRLLPTFVDELAPHYNPADPKSLKYMSTLSRIEKSSGKREGDQIVDKFSGYTISRIAFVSESEWMAATEEEGGAGGETVLQLMRDEQQMASDTTTVNAGEIIEINKDPVWSPISRMLPVDAVFFKIRVMASLFTESGGSN